MSHAMRHWPAGSIRRLYTAEDMAQGISFLSGLPNPSMIPFQYLTFGAVNPVSLQTEAITVPTEAFETSLQYLPAQGLAPLAAWFKDFVSRIHGRPICDGPAAEGQQEEEQQASVHTPWSVTIGSGIQDLLSTVFRVLLDPDDTVLFEAPTYAYVQAFHASCFSLSPAVPPPSVFLHCLPRPTVLTLSVTIFTIFYAPMYGLHFSPIHGPSFSTSPKKTR